jgi:hypothetical protein
MMTRTTALTFAATLSASALLGGQASAALLAYEGWDYGTSTIRFYDGTNFNVIGGAANGFSGAWVTTNANSNDDFAYRGTFASPTKTGVTSTGHVARIRGSGANGPTRALASTIDSSVSSTLWVSTFMEVGNSARTGTFSLLDSGGVEAVGFSLSGSATGALALRGTGGTSQTLTNAGNTSTNFFLMRIEYGITQNTLSLWNATGLNLADPLPAPTLSLTSTTDWAFNSVRLTQNNSTSHFTAFDEIRIATTLKDALTGTVVIPEPASLVLAGLGGLMILGRGRRMA